ncbi:hypothetical protein BJ986_001587 [Phycicoccus badiiscoriae]|uniref:Uncharacterized protein n=1 Tax=Pedococcus badiiscoriae TaxID=642776 RepID=A0A852WEE1_9MICO|nr:hypothetical protein [Pedococcus badiiscoriae]NYG07100.1 hypothetical protein [Pedococcus badiiscoriae]
MEDLTAQGGTVATAAGPSGSQPLAPSMSAARPGLTSRRPTSAQLLCLATLGSVAAASAWILAAALTAGHGLDHTDEGLYLLSYRWWNTDLRTFTGAQFVYGPVFQLLGHNVASLRLVRVLTIIGASAAFGWSFMRWLRIRRPNAPATRWWEAAGTTAIVACAGMSYSWLPLSPGYNDLSLLGGLLAAAVVLRMAAEVELGRAIPAWLALSTGPLVFAMLIAKWASSALTLLVVAVVAVVMIAPGGYRQMVRLVVLALASFVLTIVAVQLFLVRLDQAIPLMLSTNKLIAAGSNSPESLLLMYRLRFGELITRMAQEHWVLLSVTLIALLIRDRVGPKATAVVLVAAAAAAARSCWILVAGGALTGGNANIPKYSVAPTLVIATTLIVALGALLDWRRPTGQASSLRREGWRGAAMVALLLLLPFTQAAGTGNPIYYMAFNCFPPFAALIIFVLTGIEATPRAARAITATAAAGAVVLSASIATSGLLLHPYRVPAPSLTTAHASGVPALSSVTLTPEKAAGYSQLARLVGPYLKPGGGTYMMGFDGLPGVIFALDGRSVGEGWYSARDRRRTAAGIRAACPGGKGPWGSRPPILVFSRKVSGSEIRALKACGLTFSRDYRQLASASQTMGLTVYVGTAELAAHEKSMQ